MLSRQTTERESKRQERQVLGSCQGIKKAAEHGNNGDINCNWRTWKGHQRFRNVIVITYRSTLIWNGNNY